MKKYKFNSIGMFYCPNCKKFDDDFEFDEDKYIKTYLNPRDGYGAIITHLVCPDCKYVFAGWITNKRYPKSESLSFIDLITKYANGTYCYMDKVYEIIKMKLKNRNIDYSNFKFDMV